MKDPEKKASWLFWKNRRPGLVCAEVFQDLTVTVVAQRVQSALHDAAKGSARGRPVYKACGQKRGFGLTSVLGGARPRGRAWNQESSRQSATAQGGMCGGTASLLLA